MFSQYMNEIYKTSNQNNTVTRNSSLKLCQPPRTKAQKLLSHLESLIWNGLPDDAKLSNNENMFKHKVKKNFFKLLLKRYKDICVYYG